MFARNLPGTLRFVPLLLVCAQSYSIGLGATAADAPPGALATAILAGTGVRGGLVVHVGCGDGRLTATLRAGNGYLVHGLDTDAENVARAREHIRALGAYGSVSVDWWQANYLPYVGNLVNLLIAEDLGAVPITEVMRVLCPGGVAVVAGAGDRGPGAGIEKLQIGAATWWKLVKPWPKAIDQWTHYLHGPDNNAVAHDTVVGPPRHMQWYAGPQWARNHHKLASISSVVTAGGQLFALVDEATAANINVPGKWVMVARDAFSGVTRWKKPMASWVWHQIRFRSGPPQVTRLLVACDDRLYAPLELNAPIAAIDTATGATCAAFADTAGAEEILLTAGILVVLKGSPVAEHAFAHSAFRHAYQLPNEKTIVAVDTDTGKTLWKWSAPAGTVMPETLAADGGRVYVQIDAGVACLGLKSGVELWKYETGGKMSARRGMTFGKHTLVVADGVVLCKLSDRLTALSARDGTKLWECRAGGGFHAPLDVFVIDGIVWQGRHGGDSISPPPVQDFSEGRDLHTGQVKVTNAVAVDLQTAGHHHRCYREKATSRFIITGKRGIELIDLVGDNHSRNNWVRGGCQYGILPANGLIYAPPHACGCYVESKLRGFWALAADRPVTADPKYQVPVERRLEKGPAYGRPARAAKEGHGDWPIYRHDPLRSGIATTALPIELKQAWRVEVGGRLTPPVVADGTVVLARVDAHAVLALEATSGRMLWRHTVGGRVDSPPAIDKGRVLFGSADGRVTCLRLSDGQLEWRLLAARADIRAVALDRVESLWPVHGSVLVLDGVVYGSAGRSTWLDGGIDLFGLDPATGAVLCQTRLQSRHPVFQEGRDKAAPEHEARIEQNLTDYKTFHAADRSDAFSMAGGAIADVLVSDGTNVFLRQVKFNAELDRQEEMSRHLFSTSSLLDDSENHRSHWVLGSGDFSRLPVAYSWIVNRGWKRTSAIAVPTGVMMVFDQRAVWGVCRKGDANGKYFLFKGKNTPFSDDRAPVPDFRRTPAGDVDRYVWKDDLPARPTAMLKAGDHLYLGITPVEIPVEDPHAAYEGRMGGSIWVCAQSDGDRVAAHRLAAPVIWDGMAAANGRLFVVTADGSVECLAGAQ